VDTTFSTLTDQFLTHGLYLRGWSARTVRTYRQGLATLPSTLTKSTLVTWVVGMRQRGLTPGGINMYARTINSYLSWLHAEGHISERLRIKLLPNPPKPLRALSDAEIRRLVMFRPTNRIARRTWTITLTMLEPECGSMKCSASNAPTSICTDSCCGCKGRATAKGSCQSRSNADDGCICG
jgi:site-specific recombinase XerD